MANLTISVVNEYGQLVREAQGPESFLLANIKEGEFPVLKPKPDVAALVYWDFNKQDWLTIPPKPAPYMEYSYKQRKWLDNRTLDEAKAAKWLEIKTMRDSAELGGFEFNGEVYDSDARSQLRINTAASLNKDTTWMTRDNKSVTLSASDLKELQQALAEHVDRVNRSSQALKEKIFASSSIVEVDAITFKTVE